MLLDLALPGKNGLEVLAEIRERDPQLAVIMITAYGTVENAVNAMQAGAANFIQKPWDNEKLLADVRAAVARRRVEEENIQLKRALKQRYNFQNIVGKSEPMLRILDLVGQVAPSRSTILIQGESGTGKELIAKAIHMNSPRKDRPFVPVNAGSMPTDLLESTLFGHVKGAFTSAVASKKGLFEVADRGTLFLDEIGTMSLETQAKILRVLQDRKFMHLGGVHEVQVDVRVIAATNVDLKKHGAGRPLPRGPLLSPERHHHRAAAAAQPPRGHPAAGRALPAAVLRGERPAAETGLHRRPAAAHGLRLARQRARTGERGGARGGALRRRRPSAPICCPSSVTGRDAAARVFESSPDASLFDIVEDCERRIIVSMLERCHWNQTEAAERFHIPLSTLNQKIKRLNIEIKRKNRE